MQKFLLFCVSFMTLPALAHPITSPFYLPDSGHVLTETSAVFNKNKIKTNTTARTYHQGLAQQMVLGLGGGLAAQLQGDGHSRRLRERRQDHSHLRGLRKLFHNGLHTAFGTQL